MIKMIKNFCRKIFSGSLNQTPTILQMEAVECGAASMAMILAYFNRNATLEELRDICGISRDGSTVLSLIRAGTTYGLMSDVHRAVELPALQKLKTPSVLFMDFCHFVVYEGFYKGKYYVNDPARGRRRLSHDEMDKSFTGVALTFFEILPSTKKYEKPFWLSIWRDYLKHSRAIMSYIFFIGLALVLPGIVLPTFTQVFVDDILGLRMLKWLPGLLLLMSFFALVQMVLVWLQQYYLIRWQQKLLISKNSAMLWHILRTPLNFFLQRSPGDIAGRMSLNETVSGLFTEQLVMTAVNLLTAIFFLFILMQYNLLLTFIGVTFAAVNILLLKILAYRRRVQSMQTQSENSRLLGTMTGTLQIIESIKSNGGESEAFNTFAGTQARLMGVQMESGLVNDCAGTIPSLTSAVNNAILLLVGAWQVMDGQMTVGSFMAFQGLMNAFLAPVGQLMNVGASFQQAEGALTRIKDIMSFKEEPIFKETEYIAGKIKGDITVRELSFGYNRTLAPILNNISLKIKQGQMIAIVGSSGSGKSTLAKLLMGLFPLWKGEILYDVRPLGKISHEDLAEEVRMVEQDISFFEGTVAQNIALFDDSVELSEIIRAAEMACIKDEIMQKKDGFNEIIQENGGNYSGGQQQRIEIARAFLRKPRVLIMDEATSALDAVMEKIIIDNAKSLKLTLVVVAHRLSAIRDADEIIVLHQGEIIQSGTHEELLKQDGGYYRRLVLSES